MKQIPTGTLTFLFTDIEHSTMMWETHPDKMKIALKRHDEILREGIESHSGYIFKTVGDAFCAVFNSAIEGVLTAIELQRSLGNEQWDTTEIKVRMALHTGIAEERDGDYFGQTLNRTARLEAVGHGRQILISAPVKVLLSDCLPSEITLRELGNLKLKDLDRPEIIYQVEAPGIASHFPPLNTLKKTENNLPAQLTSFIGRKEEIRTILKLIENCKLLTLLGPGGVGKTRLCLRAAEGLLDDFKDGIWFVDLAVINTPEMVFSQIASALHIGTEINQNTELTVTSYLKNRKTLILLDNCEHLLTGCAEAADSILRNCQQVSIIATSREPLKIKGELTCEVPTMNLPEKDRINPEDLPSYDAANLFVERARLFDHGFTITEDNIATLVQICTWLDGLPIAIELAAEKVRTFTLSEILNRLKNRFRLLKSNEFNLMPRQKTLLALIDWSYNLLAEEEKKILVKLAVFPGRWDFETAELFCIEEVPIPISDTPCFFNFINGKDFPEHPEPDSLDCNGLDMDEILSSLIRKSMILKEKHGEKTIYRMLESIREYALGKLSSADSEKALRRRLLRCYTHQLENLELQIYKSLNPVPLEKELSLRIEGITNVMTVSLPDPESRIFIMRIVGSLYHYWNSYGLYREGFGWVETCLELPQCSENPVLKWKLLCSGGIFSSRIQKIQQGLAMSDEAMEISMNISSEPARAFALRVRGFLLYFIDNRAAMAALEKGIFLCEKYNLSFWLIPNLMNMGLVLIRERKLAEGLELIRKSYEMAKRYNQIHSIHVAMMNLGSIPLTTGEYEKGLFYLKEGIAVMEKAQDRLHLGLIRYNCGTVFRCLDRYEEAKKEFAIAFNLAEDMGFIQGKERALGNLALLSVLTENPQAAEELLKEALLSHTKRDLDDFDISYYTAIAFTFHRLGFDEIAAPWLFSLQESGKSWWDSFPLCDTQEIMQRLDVLKHSLPNDVYSRAADIGKQVDYDALIEKYNPFMDYI